MTWAQHLKRVFNIDIEDVPHRGHGEPRVTMPITTILVVGLGGLMAVAVAGQFFLGMTSARENTRELLGDKGQATIDGVEWTIRTTLEPVVAQAHEIARLVAEGELVVDDGAFDSFVRGALTISLRIDSILVILPDLTVRTYQRNPPYVSTGDESRNPLSRLIASDLAQARLPSWGEPQFLHDQMVSIYSTPLLDPAGDFVGALVQTVGMSKLSHEIARASRSDEQQTPFVLYGHDGVLAHPLLIEGNLDLAAVQNQLPTPNELGDSVLANIWDPDEIAIIGATPIAGDTIKGISFGDRVFLFVYRTIEGYGSKPWVVGTYFDGERTRTQVRRLALAGAGGVAILILFLVLAVIFGRGASRPVRRLALAARTIREGGLERVDDLPRSRVRELDDASVCFNEMIDGLRERAVILDLFGKFVPEDIAATMLRSPEGLQPHSSEATILFVDIAGFTALAESVEPVEIVEILNAYFTELVTIIEEHGGVITQFQGDAILAVFNVPRPLKHHAQKGIAAALAIQAAVVEKTFLGHQLKCRIGVNTGQVVAGNVGASGRMNYTVHGDAVNLAARLEQLNKEYETGILVSEDTVRQVGFKQFRKLGTVDVRGRSVPVTVYTA